ncbi:MAG: hypothetical protein HY881_09825 [Deltaproteobacteria bacterium]|nr:hypothetical protein [Deltaproteobacteria bacterium]
MKRQEIKSIGYLTAVMVFGLILIAGCATMQTWPDDQRTAENKMDAIREKIEDGLKTGTLTPDQSQSFLKKLKFLQTDYSALQGKSVYRDDWDSLIRRLDALDAEINSRRLDLLESDINRTKRIEESRNADGIIYHGSANAQEYAPTPVDYSLYGRPPIPVNILLLIPAEFESFDHVGNYERGSIRYHLGREAELELRKAFGIEFAKVDVWPVRSEARAREMLLTNDPDHDRVRTYDYVSIPKFLRTDSLERKGKYEFEIDLQVEFDANNGSNITFKGHGSFITGKYAQSTPEKGASLALQYAVSALLDGIEKSRNLFVH